MVLETVDENELKLVPASIAEHPIMQNLGRFYVYDMSEYMGGESGWEMPEDGLYECIDFKKYWEIPGAFPFFVRYKNELAGFVIVDNKASDEQVEFNMAQFFIIRKFKAKGLGKAVATQCFDQFKGNWEVMVMPQNQGAYEFWKSVISEYTENQLMEYTRPIKHFENHEMRIFSFDSR
jgi:[ribosomal protein S5]-alanine N-acetyltransferase